MRVFLEQEFKAQERAHPLDKGLLEDHPCCARLHLGPGWSLNGIVCAAAPKGKP
jgi:hypothetical protein